MMELLSECKILNHWPDWCTAVGVLCWKIVQTCEGVKGSNRFGSAILWKTMVSSYFHEIGYGTEDLDDGGSLSSDSSSESK